MRKLKAPERKEVLCMKKMIVLSWVLVILVMLTLSASLYAADSAGKAVFDKQKCGMCHGKDGKGTKMAPAIAGKSGDKIKETILKGKKKMPSFEKKLGKGDIDNLLKYLAGLK